MPQPPSLQSRLNSFTFRCRVRQLLLRIPASLARTHVCYEVVDWPTAHEHRSVRSAVRSSWRGVHFMLPICAVCGVEAQSSSSRAAVHVGSALQNQPMCG